MKRFLSSVVLIVLMLMCMVCFSSPVMAEAGKKTLVYAASADPDSLDPANALGNPSEAADRMIYENLVRFDEKLKLVPGLATEWKQAKDGMSWTFSLRKGVKFHDGTPFNAEAVKTFFERMIGPEKPARASLFAPYVQSVEVLNDYSIKVNMKMRCSFFTNNLAHSASGIISPAALKTYGKEIGRHPVGTGPFKLVEWVFGDHLTLARNNDYWAGKAGLDEIIVKTVKEDSSRVMMLQSGDADLIVNIPSEDIARLEKNPKIKLDSTDTLKVLFLGMNCSKKPFNDTKVRQALAYAIDKETIAKSLYNGGGSAVPSIVAPPTTGYFPVKGLGYDPQKAKNLLKVAGYPNGLKVNLWTPQGRYPKDFELAQAIQQQLKKIGVEVNIQAMEWAAFLAATGKAPEQADVELFIMGWSPSTAEIGYTFTMFTTSTIVPNGNNRLLYSSKEFDGIVLKFLQATTKEQMNKYLKAAQEYLANEVPCVPLIRTRLTIGYAKNLKGVINSPLELTYADYKTTFEK
ncbi:MAG TPA: glutathione ABC transporter substrate-binding protein [Syntrophorhabdaceae bacterium]|nr:glutathione ABC transporter substrate-binding protein [Syntrophorhabdaceae bacterium]